MFSYLICKYNAFLDLIYGSNMFFYQHVSITRFQIWFISIIRFQI